MKYGDKVVITNPQPYHPFSSGERCEVVELVGDACVLIEKDCSQRIVKVEDIRMYDACDEYEDMY